MNKALINDLKKFVTAKKQYDIRLRKIVSEDDWKSFVKELPSKPVAPYVPIKPVDDAVEPVRPETIPEVITKSEEEYFKEKPFNHRTKPSFTFRLSVNPYENIVFYIVEAINLLLFVIGGATQVGSSFIIARVWGIICLTIGLIVLIGGFAGPLVIGLVDSRKDYLSESEKYELYEKNYEHNKAQKYKDYVKSVEEENIKIKEQNEKNEQEYERALKECRSLRDLYLSSMKNYKRKMAELPPLFDKYNEENSKYNSEMSKLETETRQHIRTKNEQIEKTATEDFEKVKKELSIEIPEKWAEAFYLEIFIEYLEDGRVDTLKEAINLYIQERREKEMRQDEIHERLMRKEREESEARQRCYNCAYRKTCKMSDDYPINCSSYVPRD